MAKITFKGLPKKDDLQKICGKRKTSMEKLTSKGILGKKRDLLKVFYGKKLYKSSTNEGSFRLPKERRSKFILWKGFMSKRG